MRKLARSALASLVFAGFGIGSTIAAPLFLLPFSARLRRGIVCLSYRLMVAAMRMLRLVVVEVSESDRAELRSLRGAVVVMNHLTLIDVVVLSSLIGDSTCIAKSATLRNPFLALVASRVLVANNDPQRAIGEVEKVLSAGVNLVVFPEGTRGTGRGLLPLHRGAAQLSARFGAPIVAVRLSCDPLILGKGMRWLDVGDRCSRYSIEVRGRLEPTGCGPADTRAATAEIARLLA